MLFYRNILPLLLSTAIPLTSAQNASTAPGFGGIASTIPLNDTTFNFGKNFAVLNLDLITAIVSGVANTTQGHTFISNIQTWVNAVHAQSPPPLTIFTRIFFSTPEAPEVGPNSSFKAAISSLGNVTAEDASTEIFPAFNVTTDDVVLQKTRYYAGAGNGLEEILNTQEIDTVVLSGVRTSGVIISTVSHLFDLDYKVFVISDNVIESAPDEGINEAILEGIIPKLPADVITLQQALGALERSGPAAF